MPAALPYYPPAANQAWFAHCPPAYPNAWAPYPAQAYPIPVYPVPVYVQAVRSAYPWAYSGNWQPAATSAWPAYATPPSYPNVQPAGYYPPTPTWPTWPSYPVPYPGSGR